MTVDVEYTNGEILKKQVLNTVLKGTGTVLVLTNFSIDFDWFRFLFAMAEAAFKKKKGCPKAAPKRALQPEAAPSVEEAENVIKIRVSWEVIAAIEASEEEQYV